MELTREEKIGQIAQDVLRLARNNLIVHLRFMDMAISNLKCVADEDTLSLSVDGGLIRYNPVYVLRCYQEQKELVARQYLHMILHCVFLHAFVEKERDRVYWDLACDIAVECVINELELACVATEREKEQQFEIHQLRQQVKYMTAEVLYRHFLDEPLSEEKLRHLQGLFVRDEHEIWYELHVADEDSDDLQDSDRADAEVYRTKEEMHEVPQHSDAQDAETAEDVSRHEQDADTEDVSDEERDVDSAEDVSDGEKGADAKDFSGKKDAGPADRADGPTSAAREEMKGRWKDISRQMQLDLETFSREQGSVAGTLTQNLAAVNRESYDYSSFLRKFATLGENLKINDEEFDYIFYTYGLSVYGKMPLVEPLEYKEVKKIREFVIALDTSGSTSTSLIQKFVQKTYNILKQQENFFTKINLHIIQCDAEIQEDKKITCQEEFDEYLEHMQIRGLAGTDFRPVFSYVEYLMQKGEFANLKGLIYFTDGYGEFPKKQPPYQVAVVYLDEGFENPQVPVWAIKLVLTPEEV